MQVTFKNPLLFKRSYKAIVRTSIEYRAINNKPYSIGFSEKQ